MNSGGVDDDDDFEEEIILLPSDSTTTTTTDNKTSSGNGMTDSGLPPFLKSNEGCSASLPSFLLPAMIKKEEDNSNNQEEDNSNNQEEDFEEEEIMLGGIENSLSKLSVNEKYLLVVDLNGLLVDRKSKGKVRHDDKSNRGSKGGPISVGRYYAWIRPNAKEFLAFLLEHFKVLIWSSAQMKNIDNLLELLFTPQQRKQILDVFDQSNCKTLGKHPFEQYKPLFIKELDLIWDKHKSFNKTNTLLIDDSHYKAVKNPKGTAIHPKAWVFGEQEDTSLYVGGNGIRDYLESLLSARPSDITHYIFDNPFDTGMSDEELKTEQEIVKHALEQLSTGDYNNNNNNDNNN